MMEKCKNGVARRTTANNENNLLRTWQC